jgi:hypothetical protein
LIMSKPARPYFTFEDFRREKCRWIFDDKKTLDCTFYPCQNCNGKGRYHKEEDRDVIEGYKLAPNYKCTACKQTGRGEKEPLVREYKATIEKWRKDLAVWKIKNAAKQKALAKLTKADKEALGL